MLTHKFLEHSQALIDKGLYRQRRVASVEEGAIHFNSNDYLSLSSSPSIKRAYQRGFEKFAIGSLGSMLVCGYQPIHQTLEKAFSDALGVEDCLLFSSGYVANISVMRLLAQFDVHILMDKQGHASLIDGIQSAGASYARYSNEADLKSKLEKSSVNTVIVTEGIFSMSGECAALDELVRCKVEGVLVDEAHSFGVMGQEGLGSVVHHGLTEEEVPLRVIPLGKAFASFGAVVAGSGAWIDALLQVARPLIYSTAMSPACAYGLLETLEVLRSADERRAHLWGLVQYFREAITHSPLRWRDSYTPIQQLQLGCPKVALALSKRLLEQGIVCTPMRQPTVSCRDTGLRVILNHHHQPTDIDKLFQVLLDLNNGL